MTSLQKNPAARRYFVRFCWAMGAYVVILPYVLVTFLLSHPARPFAYLLAVLPALPIVGIIVAVGLYLAEEKDEFQRTLLEQTYLWAMGGTLAATSIWGFLEDFHLAPYVPGFYVFILFWILVPAANFVVRLRYRVGNE